MVKRETAILQMRRALRGQPEGRKTERSLHHSEIPDTQVPSVDNDALSLLRNYTCQDSAKEERKESAQTSLLKFGLLSKVSKLVKGLLLIHSPIFCRVRLQGWSSAVSPDLTLSSSTSSTAKWDAELPWVSLVAPW